MRRISSVQFGSMNDCHEDQTQMARTAYKAGGVASESARRDRLGKLKGRPTAGSNHPASLFELRRDEPSLGRFFWDAAIPSLMVPRGGIEPPTLRFSVACSTN